MKQNYKFFILLIISISISTLTYSQSKPKYIFLFIGDGMGTAQIEVANTYIRTVKSDSLSCINFPVLGMQKTRSLSSKVTCSAAAGTALACGKKTKVDHIGIGRLKTDTLENIGVTLQRRGYKIGIVTSVSIDHATPATFYAHDISRGSYHEIAMQLPRYNFDFFGGGAFLKPIKGEQNAYTNLHKNGYTLITSVDSLQYASKIGSKVCIFHPNKELEYGIDNKQPAFSLAAITQTAIETLYNPNGFFIMIEGGKIDWAGHANDLATNIYETVEFNKAIQKALEFYNKHPHETLIIVTADHETGGMALGSEFYKNTNNISVVSHQQASYVQFEQALHKTIENNPSDFNFEACMSLISSHFNIGETAGMTLSAKDSLRIFDAYNFVVNPETNIANNEIKRIYNLSTSTVNYSPKHRTMAIVITMHAILAEKAGVSWSTFSHTGVNVPVYALGAGQSQFKGSYHNTAIPKKIIRLTK